jgi:phosphotransferase system  glucose/maltose/N-acetylglucosamine-specific IIC component
MEFGFLGDYVVIVVVLICLCVGYVLRNIIPTDKVNKFIPLIMAGLGLVLNIWMNSWSVTPEIILGGLASGLASTGLHQAFRKLIERNDE